jgi:hypothetical protein
MHHNLNFTDELLLPFNPKENIRYILSRAPEFESSSQLTPGECFVIKLFTSKEMFKHVSTEYSRVNLKIHRRFLKNVRIREQMAWQFRQ